MKIAISLGGSVLTNEFSANGIRKYVDVLKRIEEKSDRLAIVVGGGNICREYQAIAGELGASREMLDYIGIKSTHFNASLIASAFHDYYEIPNNENEFLEAVNKRKTVVYGGLKLGQSTDAVAASAAREMKADVLINASRADGIYDSDPKKSKNAKKIFNLSYKKLKEIISHNAQLPGQYDLFDKRAADIISEEKIKTVFVSGIDAEEIYRAAFGGHNGSVVCDEQK